MHNCGVNHHVVVDELRRPCTVCQDTANRPGHQEHELRAVCAEPVVHRCLISQIELFLGGILVWLTIPLFFSPHGIFAKHRPMWISLIQAVRLSRITFSTTGLLILVIVVLSEGLNVLWNVPAENSWLMLVGIAGHAFITTGLLSATYIYYRDADLWLEQTIQQKQAKPA